MKNYLLPVCLVLLACVALTGFMGSAKLGFINSQELVSQSDAGKAAAVELETFVKEKNAAVQTRREELVKQVAEFEQLRRTMKPEEAKDREQTLERRKAELQILVQQSQRDVQIKERELTQKFLPDVLKIVKDMGAKEGYTAIFDLNTGQIVYDDKNSDITKQVLAQFNQRFNAEKSRKDTQ